MLRELDQREESKAPDWKLREEHKASDRRGMLKEKEERIDQRMRVFETGVWYYWWMFFMVSICNIVRACCTLEDYFIII